MADGALPLPFVGHLVAGPVGGGSVVHFNVEPVRKRPLKPGDSVMTRILPFGEVLEAADHLSQDEQEELIAILHRRLAQTVRQQLAADVQEARQEYAEGRCVPATPAEMIREILK
jgi:hypothetical protein